MKKHSLLVLTALAASMWLFVGESPARAQKRPIDRWEAQVRSQLEDATKILEILDVESLAPPRVGSLERDEYFDIPIQLQRGVAYSFVGVCDSACGHLAMELFDQEGTFLGSSVGLRKIPLLAIIPKRTALFTVRIHMRDCDDTYCNYGFGVYGR